MNYKDRNVHEFPPHTPPVLMCAIKSIAVVGKPRLVKCSHDIFSQINFAYISGNKAGVTVSTWTMLI